jgi:hypothetical protein
LEAQIRGELEAWSDEAYPEATVARSIAYAANIYRLATHNRAIDYARIETQIGTKFGKAGRVEQGEALKRKLTVDGQELTDRGTGVLLLRVQGENPDTHEDWEQFYIVFRGSRGEKMGRKNELGAGWAVFGRDDQMHNIDWMANFRNHEQVSPIWSNAEVKVHLGFYELYTSVRNQIQTAITRQRAANPETQIIVTGHSLGGALATLCAHDLDHQGGLEPFCIVFNSPRVGNQLFAQNFNWRIANETAWLVSDGGAFKRAYVFHQESDLISALGTHGFAEKMRNAIADVGSTPRQAADAGITFAADNVIYYHVRNRMRLTDRNVVTGMHEYTLVENELLGRQFSL